MEQQELKNLCEWKRRQAACLVEVDSLTGQLAQAMDRGDQVSVNMVLAMRGDPISQARELEDSARAYLLTLPEEDAIRGRELLDGSPAQDPGEEALSSVVAQNRRVLERIREADRRLSLRLGGRHSFYEKFRV